MAKLDTPEVARLLAEFGKRAALSGGNVYRARAYSRASDSLRALTEPLDRLIEQDRLQEIPGVGDAIADIITKLHRTGTHPALDKMRSEVPEGVLEMLGLPGLRPEKALELYRELGIDSLDELEAAARENRLKENKRFGPALERKIIDGLEILRNSIGARHIHRADELLFTAAKNLSRSDVQLKKITPAGDFRRGCELIRDLSLVAEAPRLENREEILKTGDISIHLTDPKHFGATLLLATGSQSHLDELRKFAEAKGFTLTKTGLHRDDKIVASKTEADIYKALGLQFIEPELREGRGEIALAEAHQLPELVAAKDIRGILHAHTIASDGVNTLEQMAEATRNRGYQYFGVADHSRSAHYAGGLSPEEIEEQHRAVDRLNGEYGNGFRVFKGIESDILPDGSLDYPDEVMRRFDFVVASVHSQFRMAREKQTERILRAVANPFVTILGHMTGRQLLRRPGYDADVERILAACAKHGVAIEINANPWRLDLDWRWHQRALDFGCLFSINPDAHSTAEIDLTRWGVAMARKGGVPPDRVLNCLSRNEFASYLKRRKASAVRFSGPDSADERLPNQ